MKLTLEMVNGELQEITVEDDSLDGFLNRVGKSWLILNDGAVNFDKVARVVNVED